MERIIWQYWETGDEKPAFIDGLHDLARKNAGVRVVQVTPETLTDYLADMRREISQIQELAHKADMIRTRLVYRYGGMWLDSDVLVLRDLNPIFDLLEGLDFLGFSLKPLTGADGSIKVSCFAAPKGSVVTERWIAAQDAKLPANSFGWKEIGSRLITPICREHIDRIKVLPFEMICPVPWDEVATFASLWRTPRAIIDDVVAVMLSNKSLTERYPALRRMTVDDIDAANTYLSHFVRRAKDPAYRPPPAIATAAATVMRRALNK